MCGLAPGRRGHPRRRTRCGHRRAALACAASVHRRNRHVEGCRVRRESDAVLAFLRRAGDWCVFRHLLGAFHGDIGFEPVGLNWGQSRRECRCRFLPRRELGNRKMSLAGREGCTRRIEQVVGALPLAIWAERQHPWKHLRHSVLERAAVVGRYGDELRRGDLQELIAGLRLALRHQHEIFTVASGDVDGVVFSCRKDLRCVAPTAPSPTLMPGITHPGLADAAAHG